MHGGNCNAHFICFIALRDLRPVVSVVRCLNITVSHSPHPSMIFLVVYGRKIILVYIAASWLELEVSWVFTGRTDAEAEMLILWPPDAKSWLIWKDPYAGKDLRVGGEGDDRGWESWMASPTRQTWVWVDSRSWWWTGRPGVLRFMGLQRVGRLSDWTELNWRVKWSEVRVAQLCLTVCNPMDYRVHGILQARILEWVAFSFSRGSSQPRDRTRVSCIAGGFFTSWAIREAPEDTTL